MAKKNKAEDFMPRLEIALIILFILGFLAWAVSKCSGDGDSVQPVQQTATEAAVVVDTAAILAQRDSIEQLSSPLVQTKRVPILYVTIDKLKMREQPNLKSDIILQLDLFEEVEFLEEVTKFQDTINLGRQEAASHWAYIRHSKGREGWVFGAGVDYFKHKHPGTLD